MMSSKSGVDIAKGALAGVAGGLIASFVMNQFQSALARVTPKDGGTAQPAANDEPATVKVADVVWQPFAPRT
jgi:hypothetical protein